MSRWDSRWLRERTSGASALPMGERVAPLRHWQRVGRWRAAVRGSAMIAGLGMAAAGGALTLTSAPPTVAVGLDDGAYRIGTAVLRQVALGVYTGGGSVVFRRVGGTIRAAGAAHVNGRTVTGVCTMPTGGRTETCRLTIDGQGMVCTDLFGEHGWDRHCPDGHTVHIEAASPVPVPFPVD